MNRASLQVNHDMQLVCVVIIVALGIILFEVIPEKSIWSIPVTQADEHIIALASSGGSSLLLMQKQGEERKAPTKEQNYKQYRYEKKILIVDDEPDITISFEKGLKNNGFKKIDTFNDPLLFLKNFKSCSYDLIIIDIRMPEMDGFDLYEEIRKIDNKVKVCFITAYEVNYQAMRDIFPITDTPDDIGCFIRKPVDIGSLIKHIEAELG